MATRQNLITKNVLNNYASLLKTHFVKTKHIKKRRDFDELFVSPEHSVKCSYEVLTRNHQYI